MTLLRERNMTREEEACNICAADDFYVSAF
jgi:hypothetical protein